MKLNKHIEKQKSKKVLMWDSNTMGTYTKKTEEEIRTEYDGIEEAATDEEAGVLLAELAVKKQKQK